MPRFRIVGSYASPYVRKVLAAMAVKGLDDYEIDPITAFFGNDEFERLSPLRRIPVLIDGDLALSDSSVICAYLDEAWPERPLLPETPRDRARARWFEEYADTRLGDVFIWGLFYQKIVHPLLWGAPGDQARIERTLATDRSRANATIWRVSCRKPAISSATPLASPTSRSRPSSATPHLPVSSPIPPAGPALRLM